MRANAPSLCLKRLAPLLLALLFARSPAWAQTPAELLTPGTTAWITDATGREERLRVTAVSGDVLTTATDDGLRLIPTRDVLRIRVRRADSVLNGALIGAGAAVASGLFLCTRTEPWENCRDDGGPMFTIGAVGAGIGIGIDALIRGRRTIYDKPRGSARLHASPIFTDDAKGLQLSLSF